MPLFSQLRKSSLPVKHTIYMSLEMRKRRYEKGDKSAFAAGSFFLSIWFALLHQPS
ncbi:hypothetical protein SAMN05443244_2355 [Terriglobus roseus]|uniref:Uncharacterized protein n=1 Tax=Terriglobus roseus TaxID=392734 RepID=A0A1H4NU10_9BACT|nr:hypothetical protein SAMN05443244_2355 [Terriglobus roseus]